MDPSSEKLRFMLAQTLAWQKKYIEALRRYDKLLLDFPQNSDYLLGKAYLLFWTGRLADALATLQLAKIAASDYIDLYILEVKVLYELENQVVTKNLDHTLREAGKRFPDHDWRQYAPKSVSKEATEIGISSAYDKLSNKLDSWKAFSTHLLTKRENYSLYAEFIKLEKFSLVDNSEFVSSTVAIAENYRVLLEAGHSSTHQVVPKKSWSTGINFLPKNKIGYGLAVRKSNYNFVSLKSYKLTAEKYWGAYSAVVDINTGSIKQLNGRHESIHSSAVRLAYYQSIYRLALNIAWGKEAEFITSDTSIVNETYSLALSTRYWFSANWAVSGKYHFHRQGDLYERNGLLFGLEFRF